MARLAKAYVLGEPFHSKRAAARMTAAINVHTKRLRSVLAIAHNALAHVDDWPTAYETWQREVNAALAVTTDTLGPPICEGENQ